MSARFSPSLHDGARRPLVNTRFLCCAHPPPCLPSGLPLVFMPVLIRTCCAQLASSISAALVVADMLAMHRRPLRCSRCLHPSPRRRLRLYKAQPTLRVAQDVESSPALPSERHHMPPGLSQDASTTCGTRLACASFACQLPLPLGPEAERGACTSGATHACWAHSFKRQAPRRRWSRNLPNHADCPRRLLCLTFR